jgi:hypothetical protein
VAADLVEQHLAVAVGVPAEPVSELPAVEFLSGVKQFGGAGVVAWLVGGPVSERLATPGVAGSPLFWCGRAMLYDLRRCTVMDTPPSLLPECLV